MSEDKKDIVVRPPDLQLSSKDGKKYDIFVDKESSETHKFVLDDKSIKHIGNLYGVGMSYEDIAKAISLPIDIFKQMVDNVPDLKDTLEGKKANIKSSLLGSLAKRGQEGNVSAAMAWLYLKGGEVSPHVRSSSPTEKKISIDSGKKLSAEERRNEIARLNKLLVKGGVFSKKEQIVVNKDEMEKSENNRKHILRRMGVDIDEQ